MFTADQVKAAHSKVKSGADFPAYIREIKALGVTHYQAFVSDGHIDYFGTESHKATTPAKYSALPIADAPDITTFKEELVAHQQGKTDFLTFIKMCATCGIERWTISMEKMTCSYFDKSGKEVLTEQIPQ